VLTCITTCSCRAAAPSSSSSLLVKHDSWLVNSCVCRVQLLLSCASAALSWLCCTVLLSFAAVDDQEERLASTADSLQQQQQVQPLLVAFNQKQTAVGTARATATCSCKQCLKFTRPDAPAAPAASPSGLTA
jgi:hypothetical protein